MVSKGATKSFARAAAGKTGHRHDMHDHDFHPSHPEALMRLRRARGHLDKVVQMVEESRPCTEILQQLSAVIAALGGCRALLFSEHLKTCLRPAIRQGHEVLIDELDQLAARVMKAT